jgi:tetratricopeptide (TPR) repeat protein
MVKRYGKALECFEYESTINDDIEYAKMMQAYSYYHVRDYTHAKEIMRVFCDKYPDSIMPIFYIALSHYYEGRKDFAKDIFNEIISIAQEGTIEAMLARINKAIILDEMGDTARADEAMAMAILMHPDNMKQLILNDKHLYELRDKENLTFDEMNIIETKEWSTEETLYRLGVHLASHNHPELAKRVLNYCRDLSYDKADIDAYLAHIHWFMNNEEQALQAIEGALDGRSNILFELFDISYDANISPTEFVNAIRQKKSNAN